MLKKTTLRVFSVLLALLILMPLATSVFPTIHVAPPSVGAVLTATITLDLSEAHVGDYVAVTGLGFTPDKDVTFLWGDALFPSLGFIVGNGYQRPSIQPSAWPAQVHTDALGNFMVSLQVPKLTAGTYTLKADDTVTSATATFTINPRVILRNQYAYEKHGTLATPADNPSSQYYIGLFLAEGFVGDWLTLQLSGFGEGEIVEVKIGATELDEFTMLSGNQKGYLFYASAERLPQMASGDYTVTTTGKISGITASASFKVKPELFLASPPPSPTLSQFPWVYTFDSFGLSWYSSVNASADSEFVFEATGLTGTAIQTVSIVYDGGTPIECQVTGVLTLQNGTTQGINPSTVPFSFGSPFTEGLSPKAKIVPIIPSGKMLTITITTIGAEGASFTFAKQLFSSAVGERYTDGTLMWVEGDSAVSPDSMSLSGMVDDVNKLATTGLNGTTFIPTVAYSTGSLVNKNDLEILFEVPLTPYDQSSAPLSFFDANGNGAWDSADPVYIDNDNSEDVTTGDDRVTLQTIGGTDYLPFTSVLAGEPDLGRVLVKFPAETRPSHFTSWPFVWVYLDKFGPGWVSEGDIRISSVLFPAFGFVWLGPDANGFVAVTITLSIPWIPEGFPGAGLTYNVGLWNLGVGPLGVQAGNTVTMQILANLEIISAPISHQSTWYVTEGSMVEIHGKGFRGNEGLRVSVGGKYVTTVMPSAFGTFDAWIEMPALAGGEQPVTANGVITSANTASTSITFTSALSVTPTVGYNLNPITSIMVQGKGFSAGTYQIIFDGAGIGEAVTPAFTVPDTGDEAGQINIALNLPSGAEGAHLVDVAVISNLNRSALYGAGYFTIGADVRPNAPFPTDSEFPTGTVYPSLLTLPTTTTVGTSVMVTGKGLQSSTTYYIWYDPRGTSVSQAIRVTTTPENVTTDSEGMLTAAFQIPMSSGGMRRVWVSTSPTHVSNDPETGGPVYAFVSIRPAMALGQSSGIVGATVAVLFSGLETNSQYQLWWYKPEAPIPPSEIPSSALSLASLTGATYGNSTEAVSFAVPATAEVNTVYAVDLSSYGDRFTVLANPVFFTVGKVSTKITVNVTPATVTQGEDVAINGIIEPSLSVNITLHIRDPDGKTSNKTILSTFSGTFTDTFTPDKPGTWQVWATWDGDTVYAPYSSLAATLTAKPIDLSWVYALAGVGIGVVALLLGIVITLIYFMRRRRVAPTASTPTPPSEPAPPATAAPTK